MPSSSKRKHSHLDSRSPLESCITANSPYRVSFNLSHTPLPKLEAACLISFLTDSFWNRGRPAADPNSSIEPEPPSKRIRFAATASPRRRQYASTPIVATSSWMRRQPKDAEMTDLPPSTPLPWFTSMKLPSGQEGFPGELASPASSSPETHNGVRTPTTPLPVDDGPSPVQLSPMTNRIGKPKPRGLSLVIPDRPAPKIVAENTSSSKGHGSASLNGSALGARSGFSANSSLGSGSGLSVQSPASGLSARRTKKPMPILLSPPSHNESAVKSAPNSPLFPHAAGDESDEVDGMARRELASTLRGAPRKRPSLIFAKNPPQAEVKAPVSAMPMGNSLPAAWRDPSEHILTGAGSTLQHARSVYAEGPIEVLPGLFLGDEHNACDEETLMRLGITTILNVAKETTLPFQFNETATPLLRGPQISLPSAEPRVETPAMISPQSGMLSAMMPSTAASSRSAGSFTSQYLSLPPESASSTRSSLRPHTSTPNLKRRYKDSAASVDSTAFVNDPDTASSSTDGQTDGTSSERADASASASSSSTPEAESFNHDDSTSSRRSAFDLPPTATMMTIPASPNAGRLHALRYVKLPWTHDEVDLASKDGGFRHGCAVIAEALGLNVDGKGVPLEPGNTYPNGHGKVLVHCQCGVSRSATLVIAFVMQAAALAYDFMETQALQGMHDCYNLVKDLSSSISPNCSLIYQLVEWERVLSGQATKIRSSLPVTDPDSNERTPGMPLSSGWRSDVMDEEEWLAMRAEEERREAEELAQAAARPPTSAVAAEAASRSDEQEDFDMPPPSPAPAKLAAPPLSLGKAKAKPGSRKAFTPSLALSFGARARIDQAEHSRGISIPSISNAFPHLAIDRSDEEQEANDEADDDDWGQDATMPSMDLPLMSAAPAKLGFGRAECVAPPPTSLPMLEEVDSASPSTQTSISPAPPAVVPAIGAIPALRRVAGDDRPKTKLANGFGGQSLAERRHKHKRTFSTDWPAIAGK